MKPIVLFLFTLFFFFSCSNDEKPGVDPTAVSQTATQGTWRISYFWDTDKDETLNFSGFNFTFSSGGVVTAVKDATTATGTWGVRVDDGVVKFDLLFTDPVDFVDLSGDWKVLERTDSRIKLEDVSGGNGGTDYLTFEKN